MRFCSINKLFHDQNNLQNVVGKAYAYVCTQRKTIFIFKEISMRSLYNSFLVVVGLKLKEP